MPSIDLSGRIAEKIRDDVSTSSGGGSDADTSTDDTTQPATTAQTSAGGGGDAGTAAPATTTTDPLNLDPSQRRVPIPRPTDGGDSPGGDQPTGGDTAVRPGNVDAEDIVDDVTTGGSSGGQSGTSQPSDATTPSETTADPLDQDPSNQAPPNRTTDTTNNAGGGGSGGQSDDSTGPSDATTPSDTTADPLDQDPSDQAPPTRTTDTTGTAGNGGGTTTPADGSDGGTGTDSQDGGQSGGDTQTGIEEYFEEHGITGDQAEAVKSLPGEASFTTDEGGEASAEELLAESVAEGETSAAGAGFRDKESPGGAAVTRVELAGEGEVTAQERQAFQEFKQRTDPTLEGPYRNRDTPLQVSGATREERVQEANALAAFRGSADNALERGDVKVRRTDEGVQATLPQDNPQEAVEETVQELADEDTASYLDEPGFVNSRDDLRVSDQGIGLSAQGRKSAVAARRENLDESDLEVTDSGNVVMTREALKERAAAGEPAITPDEIAVRGTGAGRTVALAEGATTAADAVASQLAGRVEGPGARDLTPSAGATEDIKQRLAAQFEKQLDVTANVSPDDINLTRTGQGFSASLTDDFQQALTRTKLAKQGIDVDRANFNAQGEFTGLDPDSNIVPDAGTGIAGSFANAFEEKVADPGAFAARKVKQGAGVVGETFATGLEKATPFVDLGGYLSRGTGQEDALETGLEGGAKGVASLATAPLQAPTLGLRAGKVGGEAAEFALEKPAQAPGAAAGATKQFAERTVTSALKNPGVTAGSLLASGAVFRAARAVGPRTSAAARYSIQPGEELLGKGLNKIPRVGSRLAPDEEPIIFSEEAAIRRAKAAGRRVRSGVETLTDQTRRLAADESAELDLTFDTEAEGTTEITAEDINTDIDEPDQTFADPSDATADRVDDPRAFERRQRKRRTTETDARGPDLAFQRSLETGSESEAEAEQRLEQAQQPDVTAEARGTRRLETSLAQQQEEPQTRGALDLLTEAQQREAVGGLDRRGAEPLFDPAVDVVSEVRNELELGFETESKSETKLKQEQEIEGETETAARVEAETERLIESEVAREQEIEQEQEQVTEGKSEQEAKAEPGEGGEQGPTFFDGPDRGRGGGGVGTTLVPGYFSEFVVARATEGGGRETPGEKVLADEPLLAELTGTLPTERQVDGGDAADEEFGFLAGEGTGFGLSFGDANGGGLL